MFCTAVAARRPISETSSTSSGVKASARAAAEGDETERRRADEQRRGEARAHPELEQLVLFRMETIGQIRAVDRPPAADRLEDRSRHGPGAARRKDVADALARHGEDLEPLALHQDDGDPVERNDSPHLADERVERLLEPERRGERASAAVGRLEDVHAPPEGVT